jgi:hypothetical protein
VRKSLFCAGTLLVLGVRMGFPSTDADPLVTACLRGGVFFVAIVVASLVSDVPERGRSTHAVHLRTRLRARTATLTV